MSGPERRLQGFPRDMTWSFNHFFAHFLLDSFGGYTTNYKTILEFFCAPMTMREEKKTFLASIESRESETYHLLLCFIVEMMKINESSWSFCACRLDVERRRGHAQVCYGREAFCYDFSIFWSNLKFSRFWIFKYFQRFNLCWRKLNF